jgi:putative aldouronate transport system substrate-binding protein
MQRKKLASIILTAVIAISVFSGCTGKKASTGSEAAVDEKGAELKIHYHANDKNTIVDQSGKLLPVFDKVQSATSYKLTNVANQVATSSTQEFQLQAAEQFPADIYGGTNIAQEVMKYGMEGGFLSLNDLIDKHAPNIKKFLSDQPEVKKAITAPDGKIYYLPYVPDGGVARTYFLRTDWLQDLGLQVPKTVEELEKVLVAFKEKDPNKNGKADEIPYFNDKWQETIRLANLWGARVYGSDSYAVRAVLDKNDKMYFAWTSDDFKEGVKNMARWYKMGLIDPEFVTRKANTARQTLLTKENRGGMTHEWVASTSGYNDNAELKKIAPNFKFEGILPPSSSKGPGFEEHQRLLVKPDGWAISAKSQHQIAAIKFMDYFFSKEGRILANFGVEGVSYDMKDGKPVFKQEALTAPGGTNKYLWENLGAQLPIGYWQDYAYEDQWTNPIGRDAVKKYTDSKVIIKNPTPVLNFNTEEKAVYDRVNNNLNTYCDEQIQKMIMGLIDVDSSWNAYVTEAKKLGVDDLVKVYQSAYDRYKSVK